VKALIINKRLMKSDPTPNQSKLPPSSLLLPSDLKLSASAACMGVPAAVATSPMASRAGAAAADPDGSEIPISLTKAEELPLLTAFRLS
jgi:hypothetical protein